MESTSDGMFDPGISFSSMKQPPLIKQLKGILSEYPDGGQILKELIQNAEDAEATEVNILYDKRRINDQSSGTTATYNKFFKGPALCVSNDAVFTEKDWDGIRMIYSSVKEDDPLKVGRFGLGFKSVFHITDYPCVISGDKLLMIDPQQPTDRVNAMVNIAKVGALEKYGLNADAFWAAFDGKFGMNRKVVKSGYFSRTLFWFPLRQKPSDLSETLYDAAKVIDLFEGFKSEASNILLFLKNLERIGVCSCGNDNVVSDIVKVEIKDKHGTVRKSRSEFKKRVQRTDSNYKSEDIHNVLQISISTTTNGQCKISDWIVVNVFVGISADPSFRKLIQDESLGYSPYVGVAAPLRISKRKLEGHVFCFLPLPREGTRLTGLPVHVNGYFALSQNRHHLKWETDEQRGRKIDDKSILWNKCLISQALPVAYQILVKSLLQRSNSNGNTPDMLKQFYSCLPVFSDTQSKWETLEAEFYARLIKQQILYCSYMRIWVPLTDACFATFCNLPQEHIHVQDAVKRCLTAIGKNFVDLPSEQFETLQHHFPHIEDLTPQLLTTYLHQNGTYKKMAYHDKLDILEYLLSDGNYMKMNGLELLPLHSGGWTSFNKYGETIYACSEDILKILLGLEHILLKDIPSMRNSLACHLRKLCSTGCSQIKEMNTSTFIGLLKKTMTLELGTSTCLRLTKSNVLTIKWLHDVWHCIIKRGNVASITALNMLPVLKEGTWKNPRVIDLARLSDLLLVKSSNGDSFGDDVCRCFEIMGVTVLDSWPPWIQDEGIMKYCFWPRPKSMFALLSKIGSSPTVNQTVAAFNRCGDWNDKIGLRNLLAKCHFEITEDAKRLIRELQIFHAVTCINGGTYDTSVIEVPRFINGNENVPDSVPLPFACLTIPSTVESLILTLGGRKIHVEEIVTESMKMFYRGTMRGMHEMEFFMKYLIDNFHLFRNNSVIINCGRTLHFLTTGPSSRRYKASELFDPSDTMLLDLLCEESLLPDAKHIQNDDDVIVLRYLGLRGLDDIDCNTLYKVARTLDKWSREDKQDRDLVRKANALMQLLISKPSILNEICQNGLTLANSIKSFSCVLVHEIVQSYPACLKWFPSSGMLCSPSDARHVSLYLLIGTTMPIVACTSEQVMTVFQWKDPPAISKVFDQLKMVRGCYSIRYKSELVPVIKALYDHLSQRENEIRHQHSVLTEEVIWTGEEFVTVDKMIVVKQEEDLDLRPYFFSLPEEYKYIKNLFGTLGCPLQQDMHILQETLLCIRTAHRKPQCKQTVRRDRRIVYDILDRLAKEVLDDNVSIDGIEILMMVHDVVNPNALKLCPITECTYDDDPALYYDENDDVNLVHEMIPIKIVEALGVKSITRKAALDAEEIGVKEWGQQEHLTTRIHALLRDGYTDGLSVPKELIQNADDAGASVVKFLYDERRNLNSRERVLSKGLKDFQGPALWIYNDAKFSDEDLENITKLNAATKQTDLKKIGKFGLGFCSVYNLTDLPSFITGSNVVFFDPHEKHLGSVLRKRGTGLKYTLPNKNLVSRHIDQFKPYDGIFGYNTDEHSLSGFDGTLFRLPLRTEQQARESKIYPLSYTRDEMIKLLRMFITAAGNMLLFSQNVRSIEIYHLQDNEKRAPKPSILFELHKNVMKWDKHIMRPVTESVLSRIPVSLERNTNFLEIHKTIIHTTIKNTCKKLIPGLAQLPQSSDTAWLTSWAKGNRNSLQMSKLLYMEGAVPLAAVAVPCMDIVTGTPMALKNVGSGFYQEGHVFCFLPLPLRTELQVHINGCFAVTSDRRQLLTLTEDDKGSNRNAWNNALLEDALVISFVHLLETLTEKEMKVDQNYTFYSLWPSNCSKELLPFKKAFYKYIIATDSKVFCGIHSWVCFRNAVFLDPKIRQQACGDLAFEVMTHFTPRPGKTLIEMPSYVLESIKQSNMDNIKLIHSAIISEKEFLMIFLDNIEDPFWEKRQEDRNKLIALAIKVSTDSDVRKEMQNKKCIPTEPQQKLCKPTELIHPSSPIASLFSVKDGRFPLNRKEYRNDTVLMKLVELGMNYEMLPGTLLIDRSESIPNLAKDCCICARERCITLVEYLSKYAVLDKFENEAETLHNLRNICMFPVLLKPKTWTFTWGTNLSDHSHLYFDGTKHCKNHRGSNEPLLLGQSKSLVRQRLRDYVGSVACLIDETVFSSVKTRRIDVQRLFTAFGVKDLDDLPLQLLIDQVCLLAREYKDKSVQFDELRRIHNTLFKRFDNIIKTYIPENIPDCMNILCDVPVVLIGTVLVQTENVAFCVKEEDAPLLYRLPDADKMIWRRIYKYLGVEEHFSISYILKGMTCLKENWQADKSHVEKLSALLVNLKDIMEKEKVQYEDLRECHDAIIAPDSHCRIWPTYDLATENVDFKANVEMKILHRDIPISVGESLGVKTKELKCFENISVSVSFGQREMLVTRIKGLLKAYPCDSSIMKELLQNADDAGATEIHFVKDYRTHSTYRLFSKSCEPLQGPALCVYNNSYFTKGDIEGIHNLGQGSKGEDPTKTGQYGVGFNAVYHLSDAPAFITKGPSGDADNYLIVLDPLCKYVPMATVAEPGQMCRLVDVQTNFPDHLLGFSQDKLITGNVGTVFRFPLRNKRSKIEGEIITIDKMDKILNSFRIEMHESVIFLKNVQCIKVSKIDTQSGVMEEEYSVNIHLSDEAREKRKCFNDTVNEVAKTNKDKKDRNLDVNPREVVYPIKVSDSSGRSKDWLIIQQFGHKGAAEKIENIKTRLRDGDLGLLPIGGVAIPLKSNCQVNEGHARSAAVQKSSFKSIFGRLGQWVSRSYPVSFRSENASYPMQKTRQMDGKAFCFLPLPVDTGLPIHINGHFALDHESRRDLWKDGYRMEWNVFILESVIVPSWIAGIIHMQTGVTKDLENSSSWFKVNDALEKYHSLFPLHNQATSDIWKTVVSQFYCQVVKQGSAIFPCVEDRKHDRVPSTDQSGTCRFHVTWTHVTVTSRTDLSGVFNNVYSHLPNGLSDRDKTSHLIGNLLKSFGMKLLETPQTIMNELKTAGFADVPVSSPSLVILFMGSVSCDVGHVNVDISRSKFRTADILRMFFYFITLDNSFADKITGLPVLLTGDGVLRKFAEDHPVFVTEFSGLVPASSCQFIHDMLWPVLIHRKVFQSEVFKKFSFQNFVELLPHSMQSSLYASGCEVYLNENDAEVFLVCVSQEWLCLFYDFVCDQSQLNTNADDEDTFHETRYSSGKSTGEIDLCIFQSNLNELNEWSLLPHVRDETQHYLIPIREATHILYLSYSQKQDSLGKALHKLCLPTLNIQAFSKCQRKEIVKSSMAKCVASLDSPSDMMECLAHHSDRIRQCESFTVGDCADIMAYFGQKLSILRQHKTERVVAQKLRELPLFITLQGTLTSLDNNQEVLVIPKGMPVSGIQEWANRCNMILLQEKESFESLYDILGLRKADIEDVYGEIILPRLDEMPVQYWMEHIVFLRDKLGQQNLNTPVRVQIIQELKQIAFINIHGQMTRANQLFDNQNQLFMQMKDTSDFPPGEFQTTEWRYFLKNLGLVCDVTDEMMIQFACKIEVEGNQHVDDALRTKSSILLSRFLKEDGTEWQTPTLHQIKSIKFITPYIADRKETEIWAQHTTSGLVCFQDATSSANCSLCWTTLNLIPQSIVWKLHKNIRCILGINEIPPVSKVILHCQNVCDALKPSLKQGSVSVDFVRQQMTNVYEYFVKFIHMDADIRQKLQYTPFVHLPDENEVVPTSEIIIDLNTYSQIKPYLYMAPKYYGKYHDLFEMLGSKSRIEFSHYVHILERIKEKCLDTEMSPFERGIAQKTLKELVRHKTETDKSIDAVRSVYLPNQDLILCRSESLVISNNYWFDYRLDRHVRINYFAGLPFLDLPKKEVIDLEEVFSKWPKRLQPRLLGDDVEEIVCLGDENERQGLHSSKALIIESFLHNPDFAAALLDIIKHQVSRSNAELEFDYEGIEHDTLSNLSSIVVLELPVLKTVLKYKGSIVKGSEVTLPYHIQKETHSTVFFFHDVNDADELDVKPIMCGLVNLIRSCVHDLDTDSVMFVTSLLHVIENPETLSEILIRLQIKPYFTNATKRDYFPKPGTYVEPRFIPFLEQGIEPFKDYEYDHVAMELEDTTTEIVDIDDDTQAVYIYVRILEECHNTSWLGDLGRTYVVRTGNPDVFPEQVPIFRLFRFVRREDDPGTELQKYDAEPITSKPFDEQCRRIRNDLKDAWKLSEADRKRVIRRLLLKWHPDKNRTNEEYCKRVFQYIKIIISRLENGESIGENAGNEMSRGPSDCSPSSSRYYDNINRSAQTQARAYYDNYNDYCRSERTGSYSHCSAPRVVRPDTAEARRWMQQSKNDFRAAEAMLPVADSVDGFNWICYLCHQCCEKSLKSARYSRDANNVPRGSFSHILTSLTSEPAMLEQARLLESRLGEHTRLRYPDAVNRPQIPSNIFKRDDAEFSVDVARKMIELVDDYIS